MTRLAVQGRLPPLDDRETFRRLANSAPWSNWNWIRWSDPVVLLMVAVIGATTLRDWYIVNISSPLIPVVQFIHYLGPAALTLLLVLREVPRIELDVLAMLAAFSVGSFTAEYSQEASIRWLGVALIVSAFGPLLQSRVGRSIRAAAWKLSSVGFIVTSVTSLLWVFLPLPMPTWGIFSGATVHPKTLSVYAALATCVLVAWTTSVNARRTIPLIVISLVVIVLSGSRASIIAVLASLLAIGAVRRIGLVRLIPGALLLGTLTVLLLPLLEKSLESETAAYYQMKGFENTRESLWATRISEFRRHPAFGVGIGMGEVILPYSETAAMGELTGEAYVNKEGRVSIEPGSSWLATFSMTGFVGGSLFLVVMAHALGAAGASRKWMDARRLAEIAGVAVCFGLHMAEGGFTLSFGNPHCLFFWLFVGVMYDSIFLDDGTPAHR